MTATEPLRLFDARQLDALATDPESCGRTAVERAQFAFWHELIRRGPHHYAGNLPQRALLLRGSGLSVPVVVTESEPGLSSVCSLKRYYVDVMGYYLTRRDPSLRRRLLLRSLGLAALLFDASGLDRAVQINNWLLSTSLVPAVLGPRARELIPLLVERFPEHCLVFRSLNELDHRDLMGELRSAGCWVLPLRIVYIATSSALSRLPGHLRADLRKLRNTDYRLVGDDSTVDYGRLAELYRAVYLDRYSFLHHPRFGAEFLRWAHQSGAMDLVALEREGRIDAFALTLREGDTVQVPCLGHDPTLARQAGLYRMVFAEVMRRARAGGYGVNWSSGVGEFKMNRGCVAARENVAIYAAHLSRKKRGLVELIARGSARLLGEPQF